MVAAFEQYRGKLQPPTGALFETVAEVEREIAQGGALLAWDGNTAVASARFRIEPDHVYVGRVAVLPTHRRRGIASALMCWVEARALQIGRDRILVGVRMSLPSNLALYQSLGYEVVDVWQHPKGPDRVATLVKRLTND